MSSCDIRLVFTLPPRDSTLQYKRCVHLWNNFPCITPLRTIFTSIQCYCGVESIPWVVYLELKTLELDTLISDHLIWISTVDTFDLCLIHSFSHFLDISTKLDQWEISRLMIGGSVSTIDTDWLHLRYFPGYKLKIKIILWLVKRQWSRYLQFYSFQLCFRCHKIIY